MCMWYWWNILVLSLRIPISQNTDVFALGTNLYTSCSCAIHKERTLQNLAYMGWCSLLGILSTMWSIRLLWPYIQKTLMLFFNSLHSSSSSDLTFLSLEPLLGSAGQINNLPGPGPLYPVSFNTSSQTAFC